MCKNFLERSFDRKEVLLSFMSVCLVLSLLIYNLGYGAGFYVGSNMGSSVKIIAAKKPKDKIRVKAWQSAIVNTRLHGIDISEYQFDNYKELIDSKAKDFVICRATVGMQVDQTCDLMYQYAKQQNKLLGVYFYAYPEDTDAEEYADFCAGAVKGYIGEAVFILDFEEDYDASWAFKWLDEFEKVTKVKPLLYTNLSMIREMDWSQVIDNNTRLWLSYYYVDDGGCYKIPDDTGSWPRKRICLYQYTTAGLGQQNTLDLDVFHGNQMDWLDLTKKQ